MLKQRRDAARTVAPRIIGFNDQSEVRGWAAQGAGALCAVPPHSVRLLEQVMQLRLFSVKLDGHSNIAQATVRISCRFVLSEFERSGNFVRDLRQPPAGARLQDLVPFLPPQLCDTHWRVARDSRSQPYYWQQETREARWDCPGLALEAPATMPASMSAADVANSVQSQQAGSSDAASDSSSIAGLSDYSQYLIMHRTSYAVLERSLMSGTHEWRFLSM